MTEDRATYAVPSPAASSHEAERRMWLMIRRGLLLVVKAIELRYGNESTKERHAA